MGKVEVERLRRAMRKDEERRETGRGRGDERNDREGRREKEEKEGKNGERVRGGEASEREKRTDA